MWVWDIVEIVVFVSDQNFSAAFPFLPPHVTGVVMYIMHPLSILSHL